ACMLCRRAEADPDICGQKLKKRGICAHVFCLYFANDIFQHWVHQVGLMRFLPEDIQRTVKRAAQRHCVCGESGATITCRETDCDRSLYLPCAVEGGCVTQFIFEYSASHLTHPFPLPLNSFCWEQGPQQAVETTPEENTTCLICLDPVGNRKSYSVMVCPACKHAWFHRGCIQGQALCAGIACFRCPQCRDQDMFLAEMFTVGIRIPLRFMSCPIHKTGGCMCLLSERQGNCDASECLCPGGREQAEEEGPWQLLLCCSCAAEGTHKHCSYWRNSTASWECNSCA
ncbi:PHF7 protein, partial [Chunga burmeisteri]|nr:PHF7 protein [Chunga burmeisteri]